MDDTPNPLIDRTHQVPQPDEDGLTLHLRERRRADTDTGQAEGAVLFVHGATLASVLWDVRLPGMSFLDAAASADMAAYSVDIRGYGRSQSHTMRTQTEPYARASDAIRDIDLAIDVIREREGVDRVNLVGGSWGSITSGLYAATIGQSKLDRLVLYAPIFSDTNADWLGMIADPDDPNRPNPRLGPCRRVTEAQLRARWDAEIPFEDKELWRPEAAFRALVDDSLDADPTSTDTEPPSFRAPNGTLLDLFEAFNHRPLYTPEAIEIPTLLIRGAADPTSSRADATGLFDRLSCPLKRYVEIGNGAHFVSAEVNGWQVFAEVTGFLHD